MKRQYREIERRERQRLKREKREQRQRVKRKLLPTAVVHMVEST